MAMKKITIYGKGGIGKSTIVSNLSVIYALEGRKVLHVGCDPKADSTISICDRKSRSTVLDVLREKRKISEISEILMSGRHGIKCVESGGPPPGLGCAGRGILRTMEIFKELNLVEKGGYDIVLYDVLGDVVCGGFAAPLRIGFGEMVFIVVSEEGMAMYAANNIARIITEYAANGITLGGLIVNLRDNDTGRLALQRFAERLNTRILGYIPRDTLFRKAEMRNSTAAEMFPDSEAISILKDVAEKIYSMRPESLSVPTPMDNDEMIDFLRGGSEDSI